MKNTYVKTTWVNNKTPINAANLNKIESAIYDLYGNTLSSGDIEPGNGINVVPGNLEGKIKIETSREVMKSESTRGIEFVNEQPEVMEQDKIYFILEHETCKLQKIMLNNNVIYEVGRG